MSKDLRHIKTAIICEVTAMNSKNILDVNSSTGVPRPQIMHDRIAAHQPLELVNGETVVVDKEKSKAVLHALASGDPDAIQDAVGSGRNMIPAFITTDGRELKINAFAKADYFGGGGAAKQSAQKTSIQECGAAVAIGRAAALGRDISVKDLASKGEIAKVMKTRYNGTEGIDAIMGLYQDPMWAKSVVNTANILRGKFDFSGMVIHRGSPWVKALEKKFNKLNKEIIDPGKRFRDINKWNPSDIWMVKKGVNVPEEVNELIELNAWLTEQYEEGNVIGVSLKLTPKDTKIKVFNYDSDLDDLLDISVKDLLVSRTNKLFRSKTGHVIYESTLGDLSFMSSLLTERDNSLDVRTNRTNTDVVGEITGQFASGGKISFNPVNMILDSLGLPNLTGRQKIARMVDKKAKGRDQFARIIDEIIEMAGDVAPEIAEEARKNFNDIVQDEQNNIHRLTSKFQAVELVRILKKAGKRKSRDFIQRSIQYASSRLDLSSVFVKVW